MTTRTEAAVRLISEKLEMELPPELLALALTRLERKPPAAGIAEVPQSESGDQTRDIDTRPLAHVVMPVHRHDAAATTAPQPGDALFQRLPQLLGQLGRGDAVQRRAELSAMASMLGGLLGSSRKKP